MKCQTIATFPTLLLNLLLYQCNPLLLGHVIIPDGINVPPSLAEVIDPEVQLPNCQMLHSNLQVAWSVFSPSMTIQLIANIDVDKEYVGFGFSPKGSSQMVGSDVAIAYIDGLLGFVDDYNITAKSPCSGILGVKKGVCRDDDAHGGTNDNQVSLTIDIKKSQKTPPFLSASSQVLECSPAYLRVFRILFFKPSGIWIRFRILPILCS